MECARSGAKKTHFKILVKQVILKVKIELLGCNYKSFDSFQTETTDPERQIYNALSNTEKFTANVFFRQDVSLW